MAIFIHLGRGSKRRWKYPEILLMVYNNKTDVKLGPLIVVGGCKRIDPCLGQLSTTGRLSSLGESMRKAS